MEMEVEHAHDTTSSLNTKQGTHVQTNTIDAYAKDLRKSAAKERAAAMADTFSARLAQKQQL